MSIQTTAASARTPRSTRARARRFVALSACCDATLLPTFPLRTCHGPQRIHSHDRRRGILLRKVRLGDVTRRGTWRKRSTRSMVRIGVQNGWEQPDVRMRPGARTSEIKGVETMEKGGEGKTEGWKGEDTPRMDKRNAGWVDEEPTPSAKPSAKKRKVKRGFREIDWNRIDKRCLETSSKEEIKCSPVHRMREYCRLHNALFTRDKDISGQIYKFTVQQIKTYLTESLEVDLETVLSIVPWGVPAGKYAALARVINFVVSRTNPFACKIKEQQAREIVIPTRVGYEVRFDVLKDLVRAEERLFCVCWMTSATPWKL